jgi:hypothetical protein
VLNAQISPGDLTYAHSNLEGLSNCTKCHEIGETVTNSKCLDCHIEIGSLVNLNRGYHSSEGVKGKKCVECHSEHHGRNFEIARFDEDSFDHNLTGFRLAGKHGTLECKKCHNEKLILDPDLKKRSNTFLGMGTSCADCHEDYHQATLSKECNTCHGKDSFKPAEFFNHDKAQYQLTGAHQKTDCIKCHKQEVRNGKNFQVFKNIQYNNCKNCHDDIHKGKLGNNCESCHTTESFHLLSNSESFDHSKTNFSLIGKHLVVKCENCHGSNFKRTIKHNKCIDCHEDYHKGELIKPGQNYDCNKCHTENGFRPSNFSIADHNKSQYELSGSHLAISCSACHKKDKDWTFRMTFKSCVNCHTNIHAGTMSDKFLQEDNCSTCHSTESWQTITFDHSATKFPLIGKHKEPGCYECHNINKSERVAEFQFRNLSSECESCHIDPHFNQFRKNGNSKCSECHTFENWNPEKFRHELTKFPLKGAHAKVNCEKCHTRKILATGIFVKYNFRSTDCAACHNKKNEEELDPK